MPEYTNAAVQTVAVNQNVLFTETPVGCNRGCVTHREGSGLVALRGIANQCRARYKVTLFVRLSQSNMVCPRALTPLWQ